MNTIPSRHFIFFDGSGATVASEKLAPTNMYKLMRALHYGDDTRQNKFYVGGVGTRGDWLSAATGRGLDQIILEGYTALSANYLEDDDVYLFGFSRGAAAARGVANLISTLGLLPIDWLSRHLKEVWEHYIGVKTQPDLMKKLDDVWFYPPPDIRFLGLFDTVPGNSWDFRKLFYKAPFRDDPLEGNVQVGVQILSLDESRLPFKPLLWKRTGSERSGSQYVEQIWMPGVHGDIGGYRDDSFLGNLSFLTMVERLKHYSRRFGWSIQWDDTVADGVLDQIRAATVVEIRNERNSLWNKLLPYSRRQVGLPDTSSEFVHPIAEHLRGKIVDYKGHPAPYQPRAIFSTSPKVIRISKRQDTAIKAAPALS